MWPQLSLQSVDLYTLTHAAPSDAMQQLVESMDALWPSLGTDDKRALRLCCTPLCDAVDAQNSGLDGAINAPVLSPATCVRLSGVSTATLRSMECLRGMVVERQGAVFPRLQSLRLLLEVRASAMRAALYACRRPA
jgi:hypothetical protein